MLTACIAIHWLVRFYVCRLFTGKWIVGDFAIRRSNAMADFVMAATATAVGRYGDLRLGLLMLALRADHHAYLSLFSWLLASLRRLLMRKKGHVSMCLPEQAC